jgi:hypothetical protein
MDDFQSADFIISNFITLETDLLKCLEYIPFIDSNMGIVSPKFIPIIMEGCSIIDSIFYDLSEKDSNRYNLKSYAEEFEETLELSENISLFLFAPLKPISPFKGWTKEQPEWWVAYNKLKHNRINNYNLSTISSAINTLTALHQLIARNKSFIGPSLKAGWINTNDFDTIDKLTSSAQLGPLHPSPPSMVIESRLFASATQENFILSYDGLYFDIDYEIDGISNRLKTLLFAHEEW